MIHIFGDPYRMIIISLISSALLTVGVLFYKYIYPKRPINLLVLLLLISILPIISNFRPGTYQAGDLTLHSAYLQSFYENLKDGIWIPRWAGNLCGGYGCPIFSFEYVLPFYIGAIFHTFGFSFLDSMKLFLATAYILSGITMYIFIKDDYGEVPAFVGALLYLFTPIRFIEMHFRVSVGTDAAFIFIPLAFFFAKKSLTGKPIFIILGAINFLLLVLAHSSITLVVVPASIVYAVIKMKNIKTLIYPIFSYVLGVGLAAYYMLPAIAEIKYTWASQVLSIDDFKPILEYIYSPARFGLLFQGNHGELRLIVGYIQLIIVAFAFYAVFRNMYQKQEKKIVIFLLIFFSICFLLMQSFTKPLWDTIFLLRTFVLPWRMLVPIAFVTAFLGAIVTRKWHRNILIMFCIFSIFITILNWGNRKMVPLAPNAFATTWVLYTEYFEPNNALYQSRYNQRGSHLDKLVLNRPKAHLEILSGKGEIQEISRTQIYHEYIVRADTKMELSENTYYFPGWNVYVDGNKVPINIRNNKHFGTLTFTIQKGLYDIQAKFEDTPVRKIGKEISFAALIIAFFTTCMVALIYKPSRKKARRLK